MFGNWKTLKHTLMLSNSVVSLTRVFCNECFRTIAHLYALVLVHSLCKHEIEFSTSFSKESNLILGSTTPVITPSLHQCNVAFVLEGFVSHMSHEAFCIYVV